MSNLRERIYLDFNASAPMCAEAREAMHEALDAGLHNPSSVHGEGRAARDMLEAARREVAEFLGVDITEIVFTSGGTEANRLGFGGLLGHAGSATGLTSACADIEHPSVLAMRGAHGAGSHVLSVNSLGLVEPEQIEEITGDILVLAVALANHELGAIQDIAGIAAALRNRPGAGYFHCDGVQALGKIELDLSTLGIDTMALSGHKIGGPKGIGVLWVRRGLELAHARGAKQERGRRAGTENLLGAVGMAAAIRALPARMARLEQIATWRDEFEAALLAQIEGSSVNGPLDSRLGTTSNIRIDGVSGELVVTALDLAGIAISSGAACSSGTNEPSAVLLALGQDREQSASAVRVSLGWQSSQTHLEVLLKELPGIVSRIRGI